MSGAKRGAGRSFAAALDGVAGAVGVSLQADARRKLLDHYELLVRWNRRMNLTTVRDPHEIAVRHFGEALFLAREIGSAPASVLDVGSGAGFPGLPLAALFPEARVTLVESVQRKAVFLREVSRSWGNVEVRNERLEAVAGAWDLSTMRAVALGAAIPHLARLSRRSAILCGEEGVEEARANAVFEWQSPVQLPWGRSRFLIQGRLPA